MHNQQLVGTAIRLFAIFLVIYAFRQAGSLISYLNNQYMEVTVSFILVASLIPILVAALLWLFPMTIAAKLTPRIHPAEASSKLSSPELVAAAFPILGLWVLASAIPDTFYWTTLVYLIKNADLGRTELSPQDIASIVSTIFELIIGFWLLLGSKGVVALIKRIRYA